MVNCLLKLAVFRGGMRVINGGESFSVGVFLGLTVSGKFSGGLFVLLGAVFWVTVFQGL